LLEILMLHSAQVHTLEGHKGVVVSLMFNSDGSEVISGGLEGTVRLRNSIETILALNY